MNDKIYKETYVITVEARQIKSSYENDRDDLRTIEYIEARGHNPMNLDTPQKTALAHAILIGWAKNKNTNWSRTEIIKEHRRVKKAAKHYGINLKESLKFDERKW